MNQFFNFACRVLISSIILFFVPKKAVALIRVLDSNLPEKSIFIPDNSLKERVQFWVRIYSHFSTTQGVFHMTHRPEIILAEVDFTDIQDNSVLSSSEKRLRIDKLLNQKRKEIVRKHKISMSSFRFQSGLKDRMEKAFFESGKYLPMMESIFTSRGLPLELTRIVFVESSFNIKAQSKVGASGLWQIMPFVAKPEGYIQKNFDKRNHPYYATKLAADIFKQNYRSLKSWPLAVTAYNHGLTGVKRMKRKADSHKISDLIESPHNTRSWGFASENFYACFLAVLEVERNAETYFGGRILTSAALQTKNINLSRTTPKAKVLKVFGGSLSRLKTMNPHVKWSRFEKSKTLPKGLPLIIPENSRLSLN